MGKASKAKPTKNPKPALQSRLNHLYACGRLLSTSVLLSSAPASSSGTPSNPPGDTPANPPGDTPGDTPAHSTSAPTSTSTSTSASTSTNSTATSNDTHAPPTPANPTDPAAAASTSAPTPTTSTSNDAPASTSTSASASAAALSRFYLSTLRSIGQKSQLRLDRQTKRSICKRCDTLLLPGAAGTCTVSVENASKGRRKWWADVQVVRCGTCGAVKRFPVGMEEWRGKEWGKKEGEKEEEREGKKGGGEKGKGKESEKARRKKQRQEARKVRVREAKEKARAEKEVLGKRSVAGRVELVLPTSTTGDAVAEGGELDGTVPEASLLVDDEEMRDAPST